MLNVKLEDDDDNSIISLDNININNLITSKKSVIKNNYWNDDHERILKSLQQSTNRLSNEYQRAYFRYKDKLQNYRIPIIIMSSISGFLSISNSGYIPPEYGKWVSLLVGFSNLMVTVISLIENFKKIDVNLNQSYNAHLNFKKLHDEITIILRLPINERDDNGYNTVSEFFTRYQSYITDAPVLQKILRNYLEDKKNESGTKILDEKGLSLEDSDDIELVNIDNNLNKRKISIENPNSQYKDFQKIKKNKANTVLKNNLENNNLENNNLENNLENNNENDLLINDNYDNDIESQKDTNSNE